MAARSLNRVTLIGNLTRDPELKYTPQGTAVCTFGVATNRSWTTTSGELKEEAQFHRIVAWQKLAELCGKLLKKGKKVYLEGRLTYRTFTGKDGVQRTVAEIVLDDFVVFDNNKKIDEKADEQITTKTQDEKTPPIEEPSAVSGEELTEPASDEEKKAGNNQEQVNPDDIPF